MDGATLQARIYAGQGKLARKMGLPFQQYRLGDTLFDPIVGGVPLGTVYAAYSKTRLFHMPPDYRDATELLWADGRTLQVRDVLVGEQETFYVAWMPINLPIEAVRCNVTLRVDRPVSGTPDSTPIASGIPASMLNTRLDMASTPGVVGGAKQPQSHWRVMLPLPEGSIQQFDVLTDQHGVQYTVNVPDFQRIGYVIEASLVL